ncbi:MAG: ubiquitin-specific protease doa4 [Phylliscum demangeonii]|nr:MAG: ubiquitin-specific protease doa4 [Phylliscum demangeonii]
MDLDPKPRHSRFDHLVALATPNSDLHEQQLQHVLQLVSRHVEQAIIHRESNRIEPAYVDFISACNILVDVVPYNVEYSTAKMAGEELYRELEEVKQKISMHVEEFQAIRDIIKAGDAGNGIAPASSAGGGLPSPASLHYPADPEPQSATSEMLKEWDALCGPSGVSPLESLHAVMDRQAHEPLTCVAPGPRPVSLKRKPVPAAKPPTLHARSLSAARQEASCAVNGLSDHACVERSARIRKTEELPPMDDVPDPSTSPRSLLQGAPLLSSLSANERARPRPSGPRMSSPRAYGSSRQSPLNGDFPHAMPRVPSPTYNPATAAPSAIDPARSTARSIFGPYGRSGSMVLTTASSDAALPMRTTESSYHDAGSSEGLTFPDETTIDAKKLVDYLKMGSDKLSILLIDVRDRTLYDEGHIFAPSVMCIEPVVLRPGMSADDIADALVLSPAKEMKLFKQRDQFDLLVCYDQPSTSTASAVSSLSSPTTDHLSIIHRALWDYNFDRTLKRRPLLLVGGLDAWTDLVGPQALISSQAFLPHVKRESGASAIRAMRAGLRDDEAMSDEQTTAVDGEYQAAEKRPADVGGMDYSHALPSSRPGEDLHLSSPGGTGSGAANNAGDPYHRSYDDFHRRYPAVAETPESMVRPRSRQGDGLPDDHDVRSSRSTVTRSRGPVSRVLAEPPKPPSRPPPAVPRQSFSGVSEKVPPLLPTTAHPPRLASPTSAGAAIRPTPPAVARTGLTNFGATCYMNAVLQCLSATTSLTAYFLSGRYQTDRQTAKALGPREVLPEAYASLLRQLWKSGLAYVAPRSFRELVARANEDFWDAHVQHDAHDFLVFLLDALHEGLNINRQRTRLNDLTPQEEGQRERLPARVASEREWRRWTHRNLSLVSRSFGGQHMSQLKCPDCGCTSTSYETFYSISLEIPRRGKSHLYECLNNYTRAEKLAVEDSWTCPRCKVPREASKQITLTRAPQILVIQLKRFKSVRRGTTDKNNLVVEFPLTGLDLTPYAVPPVTGAAAHDTRKLAGPEAQRAEAESTPPFLYDAYGVVQHFGSLTGGHYTSLIRGASPGQWMLFNDQHISNCTARNVCTAAAYLLFYVRTNAG